MLSAIHKIRNSKDQADVKANTKKIDKTSGTSFNSLMHNIPKWSDTL